MKQKFLRSMAIVACCLMTMTAAAQKVVVDSPYDYKTLSSDNGFGLMAYTDCEVVFHTLRCIALVAEKKHIPNITLFLACFLGVHDDFTNSYMKVIHGEKISVNLKITFDDGEVLTWNGAVMSNTEALLSTCVCLPMNEFSSSVRDVDNDLTTFGKFYYLKRKICNSDIVNLKIGNATIPIDEKSRPRIRLTYESMFKELSRLTGDSYDLTETVSPTAKVNSIKTEHNFRVDGKKGMYVNVSFNVDHMKGKKGRAVAYFYFQNGKQLCDYNNSYCTTDGYVSSGESFTPGYESTVYNDFRLFIPYTELHLSSGRSHLKTFVAIFDNNNKQIAESGWSNFYWDSTGNIQRQDSESYENYKQEEKEGTTYYIPQFTGH